MSDFLQSKELDFYVSAPICYGIVQTGEPQEEGVPAIEVKDIVDGKFLGISPGIFYLGEAFTALSDYRHNGKIK